MVAEIYGFIVLIIFALGWGSFCTSAVYRLPRNQLWVSTKPYCTECGHHLSFIDYISILSFFLYRGRCRYCKAKYSYYKVYFVTELSILIFFIMTYVQQGFDEIFILNTGFIVSAVIWAIVYYTHQINLNKMLLGMLFCASLKRVLLDGDIYNFLYGVFIALFFALVIRHVFFALKGKHKVAMDYLEYGEEDRFKAQNFVIVKLSMVWGCMVGVSMELIWSVMFIALLMAVFRNLKYSLPVASYGMILLMLC